MSSDYFCSRHMDKGKRVSWKVIKRVLFLLFVFGTISVGDDDADASIFMVT